MGDIRGIPALVAKVEFQAMACLTRDFRLYQMAWPTGDYVRDASTLIAMPHALHGPF